jgi:hypothetical protein
MAIVRLACFLLSVHVAMGQVAPAALRTDPVFSTVLTRRIGYPFDAERAGVYAKLYAGFDIDHRGHIKAVSILNPTKTGYYFERVIVRGLKRMPPVQPRYEGRYALPVTFAFVDPANGANIITPLGKLEAKYLQDRTLLDELKIVGGQTPVSGGRLVPQSVGEVYVTY